jgi:hypothetical protein
VTRHEFVDPDQPIMLSRDGVAEAKRLEQLKLPLADVIPIKKPVG